MCVGGVDEWIGEPVLPAAIVGFFSSSPWFTVSMACKATVRADSECL